MERSLERGQLEKLKRSPFLLLLPARPPSSPQKTPSPSPYIYIYIYIYIHIYLFTAHGTYSSSANDPSDEAPSSNKADAALIVEAFPFPLVSPPPSHASILAAEDAVALAAAAALAAAIVAAAAAALSAADVAIASLACSSDSPTREHSTSPWGKHTKD